ncbi:GDP-mannose mannosyl hydrolase [Vibrio mimicus]|nr:GDP-mannose mannosyl hydrolase [Vibrio mimicus]BCN22372.1 GDP-mannose mannosyl hydrolase [Vibrio mimicus]BCN22529.1 GDP-mannose mannosyl hydrolase [Vibrio mimicus]
MYLDNEKFNTVIQHTPLVSIDLVIKEPSGKILLGKRINKPAEDHWFVPGGRVRKDETLSDAFTRIANNELRLNLSMNDAKSLGFFEHFYQDSVFSENSSTHYVVLAFGVTLTELPSALPKEQHSDYHWFTLKELMDSERVHNHTKQYFLQGA